jgi:predicted O-methyltransferase YrrM
MLNLEPDTARFISILVRSSQRKSLLEIGTSNGYSTIWLAWAVSATGGHITSLERDADKNAQADANLQRAGLRDSVDLLLGDATEIVASLDGPFDFVFFDADRISAPDQLKFLKSKLLPGALVLADNVLSHPDEIAGYLAAIEATPDFDHIVIPIGKGLSLAYKR